MVHRGADGQLQREALTVREIAAAVGLASPSSALYQLRRLEEAGIV
ncbi:LexA family protein [Streptomyces sp. NPDC001939]